jgi:hypothetical protein
MKDFFILLLLHLHGFLTLDIVTCNRGTLDSNRPGSGVSPASPGAWATPLPRATKKKKKINSIYIYKKKKN